MCNTCNSCLDTAQITIPTGATGPTGAAGTNGTDGTNGTNGIDGTNGTNGVDGVVPGLGYTRYVAILSQDDGAAPVATVLGTNDIGAIVWSRSTAGYYGGTLVGAFPAATTWVVTGTPVGNGVVVSANRLSNDVVTISTLTAGVAQDGLLDGLSIEIRVYS